MKTIEEQDPLIEPETTQPDHEPPPYASLPTIQDTGSTSTNPLPACDSRFADLIVNRIIMPRLRAGILHGEDHETLEFVPRTRADRKKKVRRSRFDEELGFLASEYRFRFHEVQELVLQRIEEDGYKVRKLDIVIGDHEKGIVVRWKVRERKVGDQEEWWKDWAVWGQWEWKEWIETWKEWKEGWRHWRCGADD